MKIKANPRIDIYKWHKWFAWFPVKLEEGDWVWLETVLRKREISYEGSYIYTLILKNEHILR